MDRASNSFAVASFILIRNVEFFDYLHNPKCQTIDEISRVTANVPSEIALISPAFFSDDASALAKLRRAIAVTYKERRCELRRRPDRENVRTRQKHPLPPLLAVPEKCLRSSR